MNNFLFEGLDMKRNDIIMSTPICGAMGDFDLILFYFNYKNIYFIMTGGKGLRGCLYRFIIMLLFFNLH